MSIINGIVTPATRFDELSSLFGISQSVHDLGTLCKNPSINKWARYKPVRSTSWAPLTEAELAALGYGISIPVFSSLTDFVNSVNMLTPEWTYSQVFASTHRYRISDFWNATTRANDGYNHGANPPYGRLYLTGTSTQVTMRFEPTIQHQYADLTVDILRLTAGGLTNTLGSMYLGAHVYNETDGSWLNQSPYVNANTFSTGTFDADDTGKALTWQQNLINKTVRVYPFLTIYRDVTTSGNRIIPFDGLTYATFTQQAELSFFISGQMETSPEDSTKYMANLVFSIRANNVAQTSTYTECKYYIRPSTDTPFSTPTYYTYVGNYNGTSSLNLDAGETSQRYRILRNDIMKAGGNSWVAEVFFGTNGRARVPFRMEADPVVSES